MAETKLCAACKEPALFDSFVQDGYAYSGHVCIRGRCRMAWQLQHSRVVKLAGSH